MRIVSICGSTFLIDELVHSTTTSGFADFSAFAASPDTLTPSRLGRPTTSPRSRPTFAGSMSIAPTILNPGRDATCLTMAAPIGPSPKCITRMFGISLRIIAPERRIAEPSECDAVTRHDASAHGQAASIQAAA